MKFVYVMLLWLYIRKFSKYVFFVFSRGYSVFTINLNNMMKYKIR